jgi:hypothetical protein
MKHLSTPYLMTLKPSRLRAAGLTVMQCLLGLVLLWEV